MFLARRSMYRTQLDPLTSEYSLEDLSFGPEDGSPRAVEAPEPLSATGLAERFQGRISSAIVNDLFEQVALERSHEAFDELYAMLSKKAYLRVLRYIKNEDDARDLVQEIFAQIWETAPSVYPHKNSAGWILEFARRRAIDEVRSFRFRNYRKNDAFDSELHEHLLREDSEEESEKIGKRIQSAMQVLTPNQRRVMDLLLAGKNYQEISELLQSTDGAVRKMVFDSYQKIRPLILPSKEKASIPSVKPERVEAKKKKEPSSQKTSPKEKRAPKSPRERIFVELPTTPETEKDVLLKELEDLIHAQQTIQ